MSRFLIVDDNRQNLYQLQFLLQGYGHEVITATNGKEALEKAHLDPPDAVITDILMPVMDGFTLCRQWRDAPHLHAIPLLFYTATYTDSRDEAFGLSLGAARFLIKPIEPDTFVAIVTQVLREYEGGQLPAPQPSLLEEPQYLRGYSEALVRKLEDKIASLENGITRHKQTEEELRQAKERAETASRVKSEFLAMMSHELRTPLHVVLGYTDLLLESTFGELSENQIDVLKRLRRSGRILLDRLSLILDLRRLEDGRFPVEVVEVHLPGLIQQVEDEMPELRQQSGVHYFQTIDVALPSLRTDPGKLKMILRNLLSNALKFTEAGTISLVVAPVATGVEIRVTDTGLGIPAHSLTEIFEPFYQVDISGTQHRGGVGLGLHIVKRLLGLLGGRITVDSVHGRGSIFSVWLPQEGPDEGH